MFEENKIVEIEMHCVCTLHSKKAMNMCIMPRSEHACNVVKLTHNTNTQFNNNFFFLQSYKVLCTCVVKQIRPMKRPSSIQYLDALKENKEDKMRVFVCVMHSKKVVSKSIPLPKFLQSVNS